MGIWPLHRMEPAEHGNSCFPLREVDLLIFPPVYFCEHVYWCRGGKFLLRFSSFWEWL